MCFIEDLPTDAFETAIPWTWETWPEYQTANDEHPTALNVAAFFPHQTLRMWVMGAEAWERAATEAERAEMAQLLDEGLAAGAFGLSTSLMDLDRHNRLVPSRMADDQEWGDLLDVVAAHPGATFQFVPRAFEFEHFPGDMERMAGLCGARGIRANWGGFFAQENRAKERKISLELVDRLNAEGGQMATLYSARPSYVNLHFERSIMWRRRGGVARAVQRGRRRGQDGHAARRGLARAGPFGLGRLHLHLGPHQPPSHDPAGLR